MRKKMIAMLLAGGQGSRLGILTKNVAKPAVPYGGKYRIIDFPLSNCTNSGIDTVGVLTQYKPLALNSYIGTGQPWDLDVSDGGVYILPPYLGAGEKGSWFSGTANAIYQNMAFIEAYNPENVLILSGDHIYKMDYEVMLEYHKANRADVTLFLLLRQVDEGFLVSPQCVQRFLLMQHKEVDVIPSDAPESAFKRSLRCFAVIAVGLGADHIIRRGFQRFVDMGIGFIKISRIQKADAAFISMNQQTRTLGGRHIFLKGRHGERTKTELGYAQTGCAQFNNLHFTFYRVPSHRSG